MQVRAPAPAGGNLLSQLHYDYDSRGRVYNTSDLIGTVAQYRFDKASEFNRILDGAGHATQFRYGRNGELTQMLWPDGQHSRYVFYDENGRVQGTVDERATVVQYLYDAADRVTDILWPATPAQYVHITYDAADRPLIVSDGVGQREYSYDPTLHRVSRVRTTLKALPAGHNIFDVSYSYNPDGSVATMTSPAGVTGNSYDADGQLVSWRDPAGFLTLCFESYCRTRNQHTDRSPVRPLARGYTYGSSILPGDASTAPLFLSGISQTVNGQITYAYSLSTTIWATSWPCKALAQIPASSATRRSPTTCAAG